MNEWIELIDTTEHCIEKINNNPMIPQELKERRVKIASGRSTGGKMPHPPSIKVVGFNEK